MGNKASLLEPDSKVKQVPQIYSTKPEDLQELFAKSGVKKLEKKEEPKEVKVDNEIIEIGERIELGGTSEVKKGKRHGLDVAIKIYSPGIDGRKEIDFIKKLSTHPNIISFRGEGKLGQQLCLLTPYSPFGTLRHVLNNSTIEISPSLKIKWAYEIASGKIKKKNLNIIHLDIKSGNVLVVSISETERFGISVFDFGASVQVSEIPNVREKWIELSTFQYAAPELFQNEKPSFKTDIYSLGMCFWELYSRSIPWTSTQQNITESMINKILQERVIAGDRPPIPHECPPFFSDLIKSCWHSLPEYRPTADEIKKKLEHLKQNPSLWIIPVQTTSTTPSYKTLKLKFFLEHDQNAFLIELPQTLEELKEIVKIKFNIQKTFHLEIWMETLWVFLEDISLVESKSKIRVVLEEKLNWKMITDIALGGKLAQGYFGATYVGTWHLTKIALKKLHQNDISEFTKEVKILEILDHPNIVQYLGCFQSNSDLYMCFEFVSGGNLKEALKETNFEINTLVEMALSACKGMAYLSSLDIIHRDLAARNLLIGPNNNLKISDFGLSRNVGDSKIYVSTTGITPELWTAPEGLEYKKFSIKSDVWSFGVVLWEMFEKGKDPYEGENYAPIDKYLKAENRLKKPNSCPDSIWEIMFKSWDYFEEKRPDWKEIHQVLESFLTS